MMELLKQPQYVPMTVSDQTAVIWAGINGHLDDIAVADVQAFEKGFLAYLVTDYKKTMQQLARENAMTPEIEKDLKEAVTEYKKMFGKESKNHK